MDSSVRIRVSPWLFCRLTTYLPATYQNYQYPRSPICATLRWMLRRTILIALLCALPLGAAKKPKGVPMAKLPDQKAEIANLVLAEPAQKCNNYAWAVAVAAMLKQQDVPLDQNFWVEKANGGDICVDALPSMERFAKAINGAYTLDDGRKFRLQTTVIPGAPTIPDNALAPLKRGVPVLVFWNDKAYVLTGAVYDEFIYPNGQRMFIVRQLKMLDPLAPAKDREVSFVNGTDDPAGISAMVYVSATPMLWSAQ